MTNRGQLTQQTKDKARIGFAVIGYGKCAYYIADGTYEYNGKPLTNWLEISESEAMAQFDGRTPFEDLSTF